MKHMFRYTYSDYVSFLVAFPECNRVVKEIVTRCASQNPRQVNFEGCISSLSHFISLQSLSLLVFGRCERVNFNFLNHFEKLETLNLYGFDSQIGLESIQQLGNLKRLIVEDSTFTPSFVKAIGQLSDLQMLGMINVKCRDYTDLFEDVPKGLVHLRLEGCSELYGDNVYPLVQLYALGKLEIEIPASKTTMLRQLNGIPAFIYLRITEARDLNQFQFLVTNRLIKSLSFVGRRKSQFPTFITEMTTLESLNISNPVLASGSQIEMLTSLTHLSLRLKKLDRDVLRSVEQLGNSRLESLELRLPKINGRFKLTHR